MSRGRGWSRLVAVWFGEIATSLSLAPQGFPLTGRYGRYLKGIKSIIEEQGKVTFSHHRRLPYPLSYIVSKNAPLTATGATVAATPYATRDCEVALTKFQARPTATNRDRAPQAGGKSAKFSTFGGWLLRIGGRPPPTRIKAAIFCRLRGQRYDPLPRRRPHHTYPYPRSG